MDLAFFTTDEIVRELMSRPTWIGAVIQSQDQHRKVGQRHGDFEICTNLPQDTLMGILGSIMADLEVNNFEQRILE